MFLPYMGMAASLFSGAEPFEQTFSILLIEGTMWNPVKIAQAVLENKTFQNSQFYTCI